MAKETAKVTTQDTVDAAPTPAAPLWARVPKGWLILLVLVLAWGGVFLLWNGISLFSRL